MNEDGEILVVLLGDNHLSLRLPTSACVSAIEFYRDWYTAQSHDARVMYLINDENGKPVGVYRLADVTGMYRYQPLPDMHQKLLSVQERAVEVMEKQTKDISEGDEWKGNSA